MSKCFLCKERDGEKCTQMVQIRCGAPVCSECKGTHDQYHTSDLIAELKKENAHLREEHEIIVEITEPAEKVIELRKLIRSLRQEIAEMKNEI